MIVEDSRLLNRVPTMIQRIHVDYLPKYEEWVQSASYSFQKVIITFADDNRSARYISHI